MPQPLSKVRPDAKVSFHHKHSTNKPELAALVASIFARWAWIEHQLSILLLFVLGANAKPAFAMFSILNTQRLQERAIEAAAEAALPESQLEIFLAVMSVTDIVQKDRHRLAHWIWGTCPELPEHLLLANPDTFKELEFQRAHVLANPPPGGMDPAEFDKLFKIDPTQILVYSKADLERSERDLQETVGMLVLLRIYLNPPFTEEYAALLRAKGAPDPFLETSAQALERLSKLRLFQDAMARAKATKSSPEATA